MSNDIHAGGRVNLSWDLLFKVLVGVLVPITASTVSLLWSHESRLVVLETRGDRMIDDLAEIKADLKKLLGERHD